MAESPITFTGIIIILVTIFFFVMAVTTDDGKVLLWLFFPIFFPILLVAHMVKMSGKAKGVTCVHCGHSEKVFYESEIKYGRDKGKKLYRCENCRWKFVEGSPMDAIAIIYVEKTKNIPLCKICGTSENVRATDMSGDHAYFCDKCKHFVPHVCTWCGSKDSIVKKRIGKVKEHYNESLEGQPLDYCEKCETFFNHGGQIIRQEDDNRGIQRMGHVKG